MSRRSFPWPLKRSKTDNLVITGNKVILREKRLEDAPDDYRWRVDEELSRLDDARPLSLFYREFLDMYRDELNHPGLWSKRFSIDTLEGRHIGNCMYYDMDNFRRQTELGVMIGEKEYWGQGYGSDAVFTLIKHLFQTTSMRRVYLHTLEWNTRARRGFGKAGFREVRPVSRNGSIFILMEILRDDFLKNTGAEADGYKAGGG